MFRNAAGASAGTAAGGNLAENFNFFNGNVINATTPQDVWTALSVTGLAPDDTATVEFFVLKLGSGSGSVFFDSVSLTQTVVEPPDAELLTNGGFDDQDASGVDIPGSAGWDAFNGFTTNPAKPVQPALLLTARTTLLKPLVLAAEPHKLSRLQRVMSLPLLPLG